MKEGEYNKVCDVAEMLQKTPGDAKRRLANIGAKQTAAAKAELQLRILAAQTDDTAASMAYTVLADIVASYAQTQTDKLDAQVQKAIAGSAQAEFTAGKIDELFTILGEDDRGGTTTSFCLASTDGRAARADGGYGGKCKLTDTEFGSTTVDIATLLDATGFKHIKEADIGADNTGAATCALTTTTNSPRTTNSLGHTTRKVELASGLLQADLKGAGSGTWHLGAGANIAQDWVPTAGGQPIKVAYTAIATARLIDDSTTQPREPSEYLKRSAKDPQVKETLKLMLKIQRNITDPTAADNEAEAILEAVTGPKATRGDKLAADILNAKAVKITPEGETETELKLITAVDDLQTTLTFYLADQKAKLKNQVKEIVSLRSQTNTQIQKPEEV